MKLKNTAKSVFGYGLIGVGAVAGLASVILGTIYTIDKLMVFLDTGWPYMVALLLSVGAITAGTHVLDSRRP